MQVLNLVFIFSWFICVAKVDDSNKFRYIDSSLEIPIDRLPCGQQIQKTIVSLEKCGIVKSDQIKFFSCMNNVECGAQLEFEPLFVRANQFK